MLLSTPPIAGRELELRLVMQSQASGWRNCSNLNLASIRSGFACALHMHQPTIPAGPEGL